MNVFSKKYPDLLLFWFTSPWDKLRFHEVSIRKDFGSPLKDPSLLSQNCSAAQGTHCTHHIQQQRQEATTVLRAIFHRADPKGKPIFHVQLHYWRGQDRYNLKLMGFSGTAEKPDLSAPEVLTAKGAKCKINQTSRVWKNNVLKTFFLSATL